MSVGIGSHVGSVVTLTGAVYQISVGYNEGRNKRAEIGQLECC